MESATVRDFRTVRQEGKRQVVRNLTYYNLDAIISIGFRVNSKRCIQFRQWANQVLKEYLLKGYSFNQRLSNLEDRISQRKYYGGYVHVGERVFLKNLDGFIPASGEESPDAVLDVFSISGKPEERLLLDRSGHCAVDERGGRIFLFTYGDNPGLFVYHYRTEQ